MALIRCSECNNVISNKAKTCPNCGAPNKKPTSPVTKVLAYILLLPFVVLFISFLIGDPTPPTRTQSSTPSIPTSTSSKPALVTEQVLDQIRGYISEGRLGSAISTAEKYDLSQNAELTKLHANASVMLAAKKQEAADRVIENAIKASDDFGTYKNAFLTATSTLLTMPETLNGFIERVTYHNPENGLAAECSACCNEIPSIH